LGVISDAILRRLNPDGRMTATYDRYDAGPPDGRSGEGVQH
jgi:hypothetical protein